MKKLVTLLLLMLTVFSYSSKAQSNTTCNADFNFQFINGNTVLFTPVVIGDSINTFHEWHFGDGTTANSPLPIHSYTANGTYNVNHVIYKINPNGVFVCADTVIKQILIQQACTLVANFYSFPDSLSPIKIQFINTSVPLDPTDSVRWTFGDGTTSSVINPTHTYANYGTYTVCLRVKKNTGTGTTPCVKEICKTVVIGQPCNLVANFSSQPDPALPLRIKFTNLSTPVNASDSVQWNFGDGAFISGLQSNPNVANPTHNYTLPGAYTVCLKIKKISSAGSAPCVREICRTIIVQPACNILVNFSQRKDSLNPRKIYFTNLSIVTNANAIAKWTFGDGTTATSWNAVHEYAQPGNYKVCLLIQVDSNCIREKCDTVVIGQTSPNCKDLSKFKFEKFSNDNQKYKFIADYISNDIVYTWTFGDGTGSHDAIATHRYAQPGVYIACLAAWRGPNCASTTCKEIRVLPQINCDSIRVSYTYQRDPFISNRVYFYANANFPMLDQTWTISRLSPSTTPPVILHQNNPVYVFGDTGYYRVCLKAVTLGGCVKEYCNIIRIENITPLCILQVFPNPATNLINVTVQLPQPQIIKAYVYNSLNVLVKEKQQAGVTGNNLITININDLVPGAYTIKVVYGNKTCHARFNKL
jgi:PKD repeat protein